MRSPLIARPPAPRPPQVPVHEHQYAFCLVRELPRPVGPDTLASSTW